MSLKCRMPIGAGLVALVLLIGQYAYGAFGSGAITSIDKSGLVTATDLKTKQVFSFQVTDPKLLRSLKMGQLVYADFNKQQVSLDSLNPCCPIVKPQSSKQLRGPMEGGPVLDPNAPNQVRPLPQEPMQAPPNRSLQPGVGR
ncbi:protein of unknown function [Nitrospira japonica]|uniref:Uncharacterized protein n=1 Tax=Nitrospira japonica TaxID=1325564 RepID=A0A1W1I123_9BACT|nr:hypothetical protein [Nitrospira japonica]SLM46533.1 protein of unknown function [Nitrospira japonica]